jgi:hypothetical protein
MSISGKGPSWMIGEFASLKDPTPHHGVRDFHLLRIFTEILYHDSVSTIFCQRCSLSTSFIFYQQAKVSLRIHPATFRVVVNMNENDPSQISELGVIGANQRHLQA